GFGTVLGRHLTSRVEFKQLTALRFVVGLPATAILLVVFSSASVLRAVDGRAGLTLVLLALLPGLAALLLYYRGLRETPASAATLAELAFPVSAVTINYLAFGTTLGLTQWLGLAVLSATILAMGLAGSRGTRALGIEMPRGRREPPALQEA
ncbi:MAG: EamA family transporter, partial [Actinomycetota bacterium]